MPLDFKSFAVIPAAGRSTRMGSAKLLLPWRHGTILDAVLDAWRQSSVDEIVITVSIEDRQILEMCRRHAVHVVEVSMRPADMKASVLLGLQWIEEGFCPRPEDVWLLAPADMPGLNPNVIEQLLQAYQEGSPEVLAPVHEGHRGHPILLPWMLVEQVAALPPDAGINRLLQSRSVREVPCGPACLAPDIDTPDDYERLSSQTKSRGD